MSYAPPPFAVCLRCRTKRPRTVLFAAEVITFALTEGDPKVMGEAKGLVCIDEGWCRAQVADQPGRLTMVRAAR